MCDAVPSSFLFYPLDCCNTYTMTNAYDLDVTRRSRARTNNMRLRNGTDITRRSRARTDNMQRRSDALKIQAAARRSLAKKKRSARKSSVLKIQRAARKSLARRRSRRSASKKKKPLMTGLRSMR